MTVDGGGPWPAGGRGRHDDRDPYRPPWPPQWPGEPEPEAGPEPEYDLFGDGWQARPTNGMHPDTEVQPEVWATGQWLPVPQEPVPQPDGYPRQGRPEWAGPPMHEPPPAITPEEAGVFQARAFEPRTYDARSGALAPLEPVHRPAPELQQPPPGWDLMPYRPQEVEPFGAGDPPTFAVNGAGRHALPPGAARAEDEPPPPGALPHPGRAVLRRRQRRRRLLEWPFLIAFSLIAAIVVRTFVFQTFYIPSPSMHDTLLEGDRVLVNKLSYKFHDANRGDVVVFRRPENLHIEDEDLIKRVIGLPGETIEAHDSQVFIDGRGLKEPYVQKDCGGTEDFPPVTVPSGHVFVMGDNRCNSTDSRVFGPISEDLLVGRAFARIWPPSRVGWL